MPSQRIIGPRKALGPSGLGRGSMGARKGAPKEGPRKLKNEEVWKGEKTKGERKTIK